MFFNLLLIYRTACCWGTAHRPSSRRPKRPDVEMGQTNATDTEASKS